jgi:hypothetical protein
MYCNWYRMLFDGMYACNTAEWPYSNTDGGQGGEFLSTRENLLWAGLVIFQAATQIHLSLAPPRLLPVGLTVLQLPRRLD